MPKRISDTYFAPKKLAKRGAAQDKAKSVRAKDARRDAKGSKDKLKRKR